MKFNLPYREHFAVGAVLSAMALAVLDAGMANVALPGLARHFSISAADATIAVGAYQAALLAGLLPSAHIAESFGQSRLFRCGIIFFGLAGGLGAIAPSFPCLVLARIVQGFAAAAIMALGISLLRRELGDKRLPAAIAWNALTVALCAAAGPIVGVALLTIASPPLLFVAGSPVAVFALLLSFGFGNDHRSQSPVDTRAIFSLIAMVALSLGAVRMAIELPLPAIAAAVLAAFAFRSLLRRSRSASAPVLPIDLLARHSYAIQVGASVCCFIAQSSGIIALSFEVQSVTEHDALATGLLLASWPASVAIASIVARTGLVTSRNWPQGAAGASLLAIGLVTTAVFGTKLNLYFMAIGPILCGLGFGLFQLANNHALFLGAPVERSAASGGLQGTARLTGQTLGTFALSLAFSVASQEAALLSGSLIGAGFAMLAAVLSIASKRRSLSYSPTSSPLAAPEI